MTRHVEDDIPPAYEETQSGGTEAPPQASPPDSAKRATAPFALSETNAAIKGTYAVRLTDNNKRGPDVKVSSTNGPVDIGLWLQGNLDRPAEVEVNTTNGRANLAVHRETATIDVAVQSTNGPTALSIPTDFDGLVKLRSMYGAKKLEGIDGEIWPDPTGDSYSTTYRVRPARSADSPAQGGSGSGGDDKLNKEEQEYKRVQESGPKADETGPNNVGPDRASASTTNGAVRVQYAGTESPGDECSRCLVM